MRVKNRRTGLWLVACYMLQSMLFSFTASAETEKGIVHDPVTSVATGERVKLSASVADDAGVELVRAYFKHETGANYLFVNLSSTDGVNYSGTLPASSIANSTMNYLLLVKNKANQVYKSQVFTLPIKAGTAVAVSQAPIKVFTELSEAPKAIAGFSDNLTMDVAESGAKYGAVTGLYGSGNATAATAATSATNAGTVTATTTSTNVAAGTGVGSSASGSGAAASTATTTTATAATTTAAVSTTTIVAGTAVAAGAAVAVSGGSDDDDGGESTVDYSGVYTVELEGGLTDDIAGDCSANAAVRFSNVNLTVDGSSIVLDYDTGTMSGSISGNTASIDAGSLEIPAGTSGFDSTDAISWSSFSVTFADANRFSSGSLSIITSQVGIEECGFSASLSGNK